MYLELWVFKVNNGILFSHPEMVGVVLRLLEEGSA